MRVADTIGQTLAAHGVRHAYGMPGGEVVTLIDGLTKAGIEFLLARNETAAAIMAAGASVTTGAPGLLITTVGPGLTNAINGIADASQEHVPLIVISGIVDRETRALYTHQVIDHSAILRPLVKASFELERGAAGQTIARAIALATAEPPGPVHLDLSPSVAAMEEQNAMVIAPPQISQPGIAADDPAIEHVSAILSAAERPLIIAGFEAVRARAGSDLLHLAERLNAPVMTTYKAKGIVPESHDLALGGAGLSPAADEILQGAVRQADVLLFVGYDPIEMRLGWLGLGQGQTIIDISRTPADHGMHFATSRVAADPALVCRALSQNIPARKNPGNSVDNTNRLALRNRFASTQDWGPHAIIDTLNEWAGSETIVTVDSGAHRILLSQKWVAEHPLTLLQSAGFCTMAAALPLAIGVASSNRDKRVIAVVGDGGLEMGLGELSTLRDLKLPVTIVVFQDCSLALIAQKQAGLQLAERGVALGATDFAAVAKAMGGHGVNVETIGDFRSALTASSGQTSFSLIACKFDPSAYDSAF